MLYEVITNRLRGVGDGERSQDNLVRVLVPVIEKSREPGVFGEGERTGRGSYNFV